MSRADNGWDHRDDLCWTLPPEFVRPRFFYGQHLGVVDFSDWLWYHAGKDRFHGSRLHGEGVLCGLRAERYKIPGQAQTTILRISRGAALDVCGREIVVGVDHCIDIAAWFLQNLHEQSIETWLESCKSRRLYVGLCYLECPSDPAPAPKDPCGCDSGGCDYSRTREGFELRLFTPSELRAIQGASPSGAESILDALPSKGLGGAAMQDWFRDLTMSDCPEYPQEEWLWLASFEIELEDNKKVVDLRNADNSIREREVLLSTKMIQGLMAEFLANAQGSGQIGPGPRLVGMTLETIDRGQEANRLILDIEPARDPKGQPIGIIEATCEPAFASLRVMKFGPEQGWSAAEEADKPAITFHCNERSYIALTWPDNFLTEGQENMDLRLSLVPPIETPIVDRNMQPLRPMPLVLNLHFTNKDGALALADMPS